MANRDVNLRWLMHIASAALALAPVTAVAHGSGLDASGCHTNRKTNDYHCHDGHLLAGGRNVNLEMVRLGMAYVYRQYLSGSDENAYLGAEAQADRSRQGVWRWGNEVKPWDFRKGN